MITDEDEDSEYEIDLSEFSDISDIEDLGFDLNSGEKIFDEDEIYHLQKSSSKSGIIELSRREDGKIALDTIWEALVLRNKGNIRRNALIKTKYNLDLSDPEWRVLVLWSKDPQGIADHLIREHSITKNKLIDVWPVIYVVITINGFHPILEPALKVQNLQDYLTGLENLTNILLEKYNDPSIQPRHVIYLKAYDPFLRYKSLQDNSIRNNWDDIDDLCQGIKNLGFNSIHCGPVDTRGRWKNILPMARVQGVEIIPFNWTAKVGSKKDDLSPVFKELLTKTNKYGVKLATCGANDYIGLKAKGTKRLRTGICLSLTALNRLLKIAGERPLKRKELQRPKGERKCGCQDGADIGQKATREGAKGTRGECHKCVYCFVRAGNKG